MQHEQATLPHDDVHPGKGDEADHAEERRAQQCAVDRRGHHVLQMARESPGLTLLSHEALNDSDLGKGFIRRPHGFRDPVLDAGARAPERAAEYESRRHDDRRHGKRGHRETRVGDHQQRDAAHEQDDLARKLRDPGVAQRLQDGEIGRQPARQFPRAAFREIRRRQPDEVCEQIFSQPRDYAFRRGREDEHLHEIHHALHREEPEEAERQAG